MDGATNGRTLSNGTILPKVGQLKQVSAFRLFAAPHLGLRFMLFVCGEDLSSEETGSLTSHQCAVSLSLAPMCYNEQDKLRSRRNRTNEFWGKSGNDQLESIDI